MSARVIVLAGPSGAGKSHLAERLGLPILRLDDFYKDGDDPSLPCVDIAGGSPIVDWDHSDSWNAVDAMAAIEALCHEGVADIPVYDISTSRRSGRQRLELDGATHFVAEGIFAHEIVAECRRRGLLAEALCVTQWPPQTFLRRFVRDLQEHRKPPWVLLRRGLHLMRAQSAIVGRAERAGCRVVSPAQAFEMLTSRLSGSDPSAVEK